jgi:quinol monooxygenase YgiN
MIVIRFKVTSQPEKKDELRAALAKVVAPSRRLNGVVSFDIAQDLLDPNTFIATEVFEDVAARDRQEAQAEVAAVFALMPDVLAAPPEATQFHVSAAEPAV